MKKILVILSLLCLMVSCKNSETITTDNILITKHKAMANLLFDIHMAEGLEGCSFLSNADSKIVYTKIFEKHKVTPELFNEAVSYYAKHNDDHMAVYELVRNKLDSYLRFAEEKFFNRCPAENINIWKDYAVFPKGLYKMTQFLPFYICPRPEYLNKPLIINK